MKRLLFIFFIISSFTRLFAVPAYPHPVVFTQPNGEQVTLIMQGDELVRFAQTLDGYTLLYNNEGYFCYAQKNISGDIEPSAFYAEEISKRSVEVEEFLTHISKELPYSEMQMSAYQQIRNVVENENRNRKGNTTGVRKLLVILMEYPDRPFVYTQEDFYNLFNQIKYTEYGANGSVKDFFFESSYNKLDVQTTVVGPFTAKNKHDYYGNDFENARELATEAVYAAHGAGVNFFDFAIDGEVSSFYMIFAGNGQEAGAGASSIWSHAWSVYPPIYLDDVKISSYACSPEHRGASGTAITRIGVICHEFGHSLGAPDYYDTNYGTGGQYEGTGTWDLQASGSWNDNGRTPAPPNPHSKIYIYGWATAMELDSAQTVTIPSARLYENAFFRINTQTPGEYFILENKTRGGYDNYIPGVNMLIYHCAADLIGMNTTSPQKFYPVAANAPVDLPSAGTNYQSHYGTINSAKCTWPGYTKKTEFTDLTTPAMLSWDRQPTNLPITNISVQGNYITFDIKGGGKKNDYIVFLPNFHGCTVKPEPESTSPVSEGDKFEFKVSIDSIYNQSKIIVKSNGKIITPSHDIYTLSDIQSDQVVTIEGLKINTVKISASSTENGTIFPEGIIEVSVGNNQHFEIDPDLGFSIEDVLVDGISVGPVESYVFKNTTESHSIVARFKYGDKYFIYPSSNSLHFSTHPGICSEYQIVTITSPKLADNITVIAPDKFEISDKGKKWYKSFLIIKTHIPFNLYVRYCPKEEDSENILEKITLCSKEAYSEIVLTGEIVLDIPANERSKFIVYPNPTTGELRITNYELRIDNVEIYDVFGRKVYDDKNSYGLTVLRSYDLTTDGVGIDLTAFPAGIYFLKITTETGFVMRKVVKQ